MTPAAQFAATLARELFRSKYHRMRAAFIVACVVAGLALAFAFYVGSVCAP